MTTNSFGGALPRLYAVPTIQPAVSKASIFKGLPLSARVVSVAAAAGLAYYTASQVEQNRESQSFNDRSPTSFVNSSYNERQTIPDRIRPRTN